jgi:hypothetical protein
MVMRANNEAVVVKSFRKLSYANRDFVCDLYLWIVVVATFHGDERIMASIKNENQFS